MVAGLGVQKLSTQESLEEIERRILERLRQSSQHNFQHVATYRAPEPVQQSVPQEDKISQLERHTLKRSVFSTRTEMTVALMAVFLTIFFNANGWDGFLITGRWPISASELTIVFPWALVVVAAALLRSFFLVGDSVYTLGKRHLRALSGNYAMERKEVEIPYESILFVEVNQNIIDRIFRVGTIQAGRNTQAKAEIVMSGVRYPHHWVKIIKQRMNMAKGVADKEDFLD